MEWWVGVELVICVCLGRLRAMSGGDVLADDP